MEGNFLLPIMVFLPMAGAVISSVAGGREKRMASSDQADIGNKGAKIRDGIVALTVLLELGLMLYLLVSYDLSDSIIREAPKGAENLNGFVVYYMIPDFCGMGLHFLLDGFRALYGTIACFMWAVSTFFGREYFAGHRKMSRYYFFLLLTLGATVGVFFSADLFTLFIFFEIMSMASYVWVAHDEKEESLRAADTYMGIAVIGGLVMLMGIFLLYHETKTLRIDELYALCSKVFGGEETGINPQILYASGLCMLFGFGAKAGAFPLHIWLPKAHPVAPAPASGLLSGILTKAGIFGILILGSNLFLYDSRWGTLILIIGVITMIVGAVLALFSVNLKRTLACSSVSQIGFILVGIGMQGLLGQHGSLAVRGTLLHMVNHSLFKLILFMAAGVVYMNIHQLDLNKIRGYGRKKPLLQFIFLMGSLGISGIPLWSGYISKTLLHESIVEYIEELHMGNIQGRLLGVSQMKVVEWLFLICGGITVAYMIKLCVCLFIEKNKDEELQKKYDAMPSLCMNKTSGFVLALSAAVVPVMGILPGIVMDWMADLGENFMHSETMGSRISYFSMVNLKGSLVSIALGVIIYFVVVRGWLMGREDKEGCYLDRWNKYWDLENSVYRPVLLRILPAIFCVLCRICDNILDALIVLLRKTLYRDSKLPHELEEGTFYTHALGSGMNSILYGLNKTMWKKNPKKKDFEHSLALRHEEISEDNTIIGRSLSFGLLLFCGGLILTLIYLLFN